MIVSRTEILVGLGMVTLVGFGALVWSRGRPRFEVVRAGDVQPVALREHQPGGNAPSGFEAYATLGEGTMPTRLFVRLPPRARGRFVAAKYGGRIPNAIVAQAFLPNGDALPLSVERTDSNRDEALVSIPRDLPPEASSLDVEMTGAGMRPSRWLLLNLPSGGTAYDRATIRSEQRLGALSVFGKAWRIDERAPIGSSAGSGILVGIAAPGFRAGPDEATEMEVYLDNPFQEPGATPNDSGSLTQTWNGGKAIAFSRGTPYAGYVRTARVRGSLRRYKAFDEWVDFGVVPLRPRPKSYGKASLYDAEPDLKAPRFATSPSGLRLVLEPHPILDDNGFGGDSQSLTFLVHVDETTRRKGLPRDFPTARPLIGLNRSGGKDALFNSLDPSPGSESRNSVWGFFRKGKPNSVRMRLRVRRSVLTQDTLFDLRLPVKPLPMASNAHANANATMVYEADPETLLPKR